MNVLVLSSRDLLQPAVPRCGHLTELTRRLARRHEVHLACVTERRDAAASGELERRVPGLRSLSLLAPPAWATLPLRLAARVARRQPLQTGVSLDARSRRALAGLFREVKPDVVVHDTVRLLDALEILRPLGEARHVLDMDDLFSRRYRRMLEAEHHGPVLGHFARRLPGWLSGAGERLGRPLLRHESAALARLERLAPARYDAVVLVSSIEAEHLRARTGAAVTCIPQLVPGLGLDEPLPVADQESGDAAFFVGNFRYAPNAAALDWLLDRVLPEILSRRPAFRLHVFGPHVPPALAARLAGSAAVIAHGWVDDLRSALAPLRICLAPMVFGSGVKTKLLEAMAWERVVVSNAVGLEGLPVRCGEHALAAEGPAEIARHVLGLLDDPARQEAIGTAAGRLVRERFDPEILERAWLEVLEASA